jgi:predicted  nucleic acid-binding Zn-ribbon protein
MLENEINDKFETLAQQKSSLEKEKLELVEKHDKLKEKLKVAQISHEEEIAEVIIHFNSIFDL